MISAVEVSLKPGLPDPRGEGITRSIKDLGIEHDISVYTHDIYWLEGGVSPTELERIAGCLLSDPIVQEYHLNPNWAADEYSCHSLTITYNPGVTDPVEGTVMKALRDMGASSVTAVKTATRYVLKGILTGEEISIIAARLLVNPIIQHTVDRKPERFSESPSYKFNLLYIDLLGSNEAELTRLGRDYCLSPSELKNVVEHFKKLGHNPTDAELETLAQTWSEHCVHKTFKARFNFNGLVIDNLLKSTIIEATQKLDKPWCLSVFEDNAGVIEFDDKWAVCFKVETHNHPSAIEPYGGAATGIGGVVRDVMGTGMSAKPIANTDVFAFGPPDLPYEALPEGALHPRRIFKGVRAGVADYGNRLGIPTINGAVIFDERYTANPLVFCGTVGLLPRALAQRGKHRPGDLVVLAGGRTGRDGIHGVTFASEQLTRESTELSFTSVQIGNAIVEKKVIDALLKCRDKQLFSRITDCGGGGLSSAVGEMAEDTGVKVFLDRVPLKYAGLSYSEIWISESQERMLLAVPPKNIEALLAVFAEESSEATVIGEFTDDKRLCLFYQNNLVADLEMAFLHKGRPPVVLEASWQEPRLEEPVIIAAASLNEPLLRILSAWNVCSKEWVIRQYDHEVQGGSALKPLVGRNGDGPGDAAIIRPLLDSTRGIIISCGISPRFGDLDPYWMAASAIDEALRQVIAVGGSLERVALLDNFCWGSVKDKNSLGALVRAAQACHDMSLTYGVPFISGKDSLNNEYEHLGRRISIPHTLLISAMAVMDDTRRSVSMDFKQAGDLVYIIGRTRNELGGSEYYAVNDQTGKFVPRVDAPRAKKLMETLSRVTGAGLVNACHDLSEGGLGVALAEMAFAGGLGAEIDLTRVPVDNVNRDDSILFSESNTRFLAEVRPECRTSFEKTMAGGDLGLIGRVTLEPNVKISGLMGTEVVSLPINTLKEAWQRPLRW
jgi:phosphoribosylformylglycinamidine synthase II